MLGPETCDSVKHKSESKSVDTIGSYQNGKDLLGLSPGSEEEHDKGSYDPEKEATLRKVEAENQEKMDALDVIEMKSEDEDVMKDVTDYAAGLMSAVSSWWSSAPGSVGR